MYRNVWDSCYKSVCSICFYTESGIKLNSLTGFLIENNIVTDEFIYSIKNCSEVVFSFYEKNGNTVSHSSKIAYSEFKRRLNRVAEFENEGFALIHTEGLDLDQHPFLIPELNLQNEVGTSIAIIGFNEDHCNISFKAGAISSFVKMENGRQYLQFEATVKQGNSGSPVINLETGKVIGVVGYRLSAFTRAYESFKSIIDENLKLLKKSEGKMNIMDIDPIQVLIANQNQLKQISKEFYKAALMSYGFAVKISSIGIYLNVAKNPDSRVISIYK